MTLKEKDEEAIRDAREAIYEAMNYKLLAEAQRDKAIKQAAKRGASVREIAEVAGVSHQRVAQIVGAQR